MHFDADVAIVGTGAGGGVAAEILAQAGLHVIMIEEGPHKTAADFRMLERQAYPDLYQESAGRKTKDKAINILQGRAVGGSTTVNWTASFRTPPAALRFWQERFAVRSSSESDLAPWFERMERRLNIAPWALPPNGNNDVLRRGCAKLGIPSAVVPRNVNGCRNLGYCGMGCPVDAKQSMLVSTIPEALARGAVLLSRARAERLQRTGDRITTLECRALDADGLRPGPHKISVRARHFVLAAGAIGSPALLLRSALPDPHKRVGVRTFLHPVVLSSALMPEVVNGFSGAPQSVYSDHFLDEAPIDGPLGYKLEVPPLHPVLMATTFVGYGRGHSATMAATANAQAIIAIMRDGFHERSTGGTVELRSDGSPVLDYPLSEVVWEAARRALRTMARIQFAAGATTVIPLHEDAHPYATLAQAEAAIDRLDMAPLRTRVVSAHVMGGCGMGEDPAASVVDSFGKHHHLANLSVFDGSIFPTSLGANPQLSIYGMTARNAARLGQALARS